MLVLMVSEGDRWWGLLAEHLAWCWVRAGSWSRSRPWRVCHRSVELFPPLVAEVLRATSFISFFRDWLFSSSFPRNAAQYPSHKFAHIFIHKLARLVLCL